MGARLSSNPLQTSVVVLYTPRMHPPPFCDACKIAIQDGMGNAMTIRHQDRAIDLCDTCSVVIVAMLKDMRVLSNI
jgi:hypothetical protein